MSNPFNRIGISALLPVIVKNGKINEKFSFDSCYIHSCELYCQPSFKKGV